MPDGVIVENGIVIARVYGWVSESDERFVACDATIGEPLPWPRERRNQLLTSSDWTQMPDADLTVAQKLAWKGYRQALRDLPIVSPHPIDVEWPTPPA